MSKSGVVKRNGAAGLVLVGALAVVSAGCNAHVTSPSSSGNTTHVNASQSPGAYIAVGGLLVVGGGLLAYDASAHEDHYKYNTHTLFEIVGVIAMITGAIGIARGAVMYSTQ
jgi:hypothetical protein